jgi:hypothetical protein
MTSHLKQLTLGLCALCALVPAHADEPSSMVVVRDAITGQLRSATAAEMQALNAQRPMTPVLPPQASIHGTPRPAATTMPNGAMRINVGRESLIYAVTQRDANGKLQMQCVSGKASAAAALTQALPPATSHVEEHDHDHQ